MHILRSRKTYIALFCIYLAAVAVACFSKPSNLPDMGSGTLFGIPMDKVLHFIMFLPFPVLASMSIIEPKRSMAAKLSVLLVIAFTGIGLAYGTEAIQAQLGYRSYDVIDLLADTIGIAAGAIATSLLIICFRPKQ